MGSPEGRFTPGDLHLLKKLLRWPAAKLFPGLDVARLMALQPAGQADLAADAGAIELSPLGTLLSSATMRPHLQEEISSSGRWGILCTNQCSACAWHAQLSTKLCSLPWPSLGTIVDALWV